jgi:hypothetical protein
MDAHGGTSHVPDSREQDSPHRQRTLEQRPMRPDTISIWVFRFSYEVQSHGGVATVRDGDQEWELLVSDLVDPLESLAIATRDLALGASVSRADWEEDPGTLRWVLQRKNGRILIRVLRLPQMFTNEPDEMGEAVFALECRLEEFIGQVLSELRRILEVHGVDGYQKLSPHARGFPMATYKELQALSRSSKMACRNQRRGQNS